MLYVTDPTHGQVLRVDPSTGSYTVFASGLPKTPPGFGDGGTFDVTFIGNTAYALVSEVSSDLNYLDPSLDLHDIDGIYRIDGPDRFTIVANIGARSEEHTSELQSRLHLVCRLLLEKKKNTNNFYVHDCHLTPHKRDAS